MDTFDQPLQISTYARGANNQQIYVEALNITFYMSHKTLVAFESPSIGLVVLDIKTSSTTLAHLGAIEGRAKTLTARVNSNTFYDKYNEAMNFHRDILVLRANTAKENKDKTMRDKAYARRLELNSSNCH